MDRANCATFILLMGVTNCTLDKSNDTCLAHKDAKKIFKKVSNVEMHWKSMLFINKIGL